jgi:hypothetical protein
MKQYVNFGFLVSANNLHIIFDTLYEGILQYS